MPEQTLSIRAMTTAYCEGSWENRAYLDVSTGEVVMISELLRKELQEAYDEVDDERLTAEYATNQDLQLAHSVEMDDERYRKIPEWPNKWLDRQWFADEADPAMIQLLSSAIELRNEMLWTMRVNMDQPTALAWESYLHQLIQDRISEWLHEFELTWNTDHATF